MENHLPEGPPSRRNDAALLLDSLQSDRTGLAGRFREPTWFAPVLGAIAALFIASPAMPEFLGQGPMLTSLTVMGILLVVAHQRATGIKPSGFQFREGALFAAALIATLFFFSVSLGLAVSGLPWWIPAPTIVGFLTVAGLGRLGISAVSGRVNNVS